MPRVCLSIIVILIYGFIFIVILIVILLQDMVRVALGEIAERTDCVHYYVLQLVQVAEVRSGG